MPEPQTQPVLVRDGTVVPTAVGVSDPSLTLVEFTGGIGFFLAESFQLDSLTRIDALENVSVLQHADHAWNASEHERILLSWDRERVAERKLLVDELGVATSRWTPAVFFLPAEEFHAHRESLRQRQPEQVLRAAFARAAAMPALEAKLLRLWTRHREAMDRLFVPLPKGRAQPSRVQPKKETVRISLPPKPAANETVRLELPPRKAKSASTDITAEERTEIANWLRRFLPPNDPPPAK